MGPFPSPLWDCEGLPRQSSATMTRAAESVSILLPLGSLQSPGGGREPGACGWAGWSWADPGAGADQVAVTLRHQASELNCPARLGDLYKPGEGHEDLLAGCPEFPNLGLPGEEWWPAKDWPDVILPLSNTWEEGLRNECPSSVPGSTPQIFPSSLSSDWSVSRWGAWTGWLVHSMGSSAG